MSDMVVSRRKNAIIIEVSGCIDSMNADHFGKVLNGVVNDGGVNLVLDLAAVDYINRAGLRELVVALTRARRRAGDLRLAQPSEQVYKILQISGIAPIFRMFHTQDDAVNSY